MRAYLEAHLHRGNQIGIVATVIGVRAHGSSEVAYVLVSVLVAQAGHERYERPTVGIAEVGGHDVVAVLVVVASLRVVDVIAVLGTGVIDVVGALVVTYYVLEAGLYGVVLVKGRGVVGL